MCNVLWLQQLVQCESSNSSYITVPEKREDFSLAKKTDNSISDKKSDDSSLDSNEENLQDAHLPDDEIVKSKIKHPFIVRSNCFILPHPVTDEVCQILSEALKIIFSQTVNWMDEDDYEEVS